MKTQDGFNIREKIQIILKKVGFHYQALHRLAGNKFFERSSFLKILPAKPLQIALRYFVESDFSRIRRNLK